MEGREEPSDSDLLHQLRAENIEHTMQIAQLRQQLSERYPSDPGNDLSVLMSEIQALRSVVSEREVGAVKL